MQEFMHCKYGLYCAGRSTKVALRVKTKRLITSILGPGCDPEESQGGYSCT
jgi:hypothetical protein